MGTIEDAVRSAIVRTVRRELRSGLGPVSKEVRELQQSVSQLERTLASLKHSARLVPSGVGGPLPKIEVTEAEVRRARMSPERIKKLRFMCLSTNGDEVRVADVATALTTLLSELETAEKQVGELPVDVGLVLRATRQASGDGAVRRPS